MNTSSSPLLQWWCARALAPSLWSTAAGELLTAPITNTEPASSSPAIQATSD